MLYNGRQWPIEIAKSILMADVMGLRKKCPTKRRPEVKKISKLSQKLSKLINNMLRHLSRR